MIREDAPIMSTSMRSPEEIRQLGLTALTHSLGPVDTLRFLQQFDRGQGDYTKQRDDVLGHPQLQEVVAELQNITSAAFLKEKKPR
jgi:hypothetical protein